MRSRRRLRWSSIAGLVLGVVGASVVATAPAAATIPGLTRVQNTVAGLNVAVAAKVNCPFDYRVYGLGGEITGGNGQVALVSMLPDAALTSVTVIAVPVVAAVAPWNVTAYAICGRPTPQLHLEVTPAPGAGVDVEVCDGGTALWGSGARQGGHPAATLREMAPAAAAAPPFWTRASVNGPPGGVASAAICGLNLGQFSMVAPAFGIASTVTCPGATRVHSTGGLIAGANPAIVFEGIVPNAALTQVRVTARDGGGPRPTLAFAVCA